MTVGLGRIEGLIYLEPSSTVTGFKLPPANNQEVKPKQEGKSREKVSEIANLLRRQREAERPLSGWSEERIVKIPEITKVEHSETATSALSPALDFWEEDFTFEQLIFGVKPKPTPNFPKESDDLKKERVKGGLKRSPAVYFERTY